MTCASALSTARNSDAAFREVLDRVAEQLDGETADLVVAFVTAHHADALGRLSTECRSRGMGRHFLGATGESIAGEDREIEGATAAALWAIRLPEGATIRPVRMEWAEDGISGFPTELEGPSSGRTFLLLADPFSFPPDRLFLTLDQSAPGLRVVGGMASGANAPGGNRLALDDRVFEDGAVGLILDGPVAIRTVVSQGCRPIGRPMIITRAQKNLIQELGRRPAVEALREMFESLDQADQALVREGLHVGRVNNEYQESFGRGDFLVRNVMGADDQGAIAITDLVRVGQTIQFHVRDAESADEDLRHLLAADRRAHPDLPPAGALLFTCNGRGSRLFPAPNHDVSAIRDAFGPIPIAGFFAMGELGPIGGKNFVHGFTASIALFGAESPDARPSS